MAEIGHIALVLALVAAIYTVVAAFISPRFGPRYLARSTQSSILAVFGLYTLALGLILYAFYAKDFSFRIVAEHSSRDLPAVYTLSALYADKAGSLLFWGWLVSLFAALLVWRRSANQQPVIPYALAILAIIEAFFIALITFGVNIFEKYPAPPVDGFGLNPLLQNFGMLVHPPLLYLGFAGFAVVFALLMAALATRSLDTGWSNQVRRWTIFAWCALGIGNLVGMWWSYNELGWGGYWAWDPVENAGLMPWLLGTAFLHSIVMARQRNYLQRWSFCLIIFTFAFTFLSPFITHGGIESPLHGFYGSPFPPYILAAILIMLVGSLWLLYSRRQGLCREVRPASLISREGAFLLTNIILVALVFVIFIGTVLPQVVAGLSGTKIALDRGFFDRICGPIMLTLVFFMGVCPLLGWGKSVWNSAWRNVIYFFLAILVMAAAIVISGIGNWYIAAVTVCGFPLFIIFQEWYRGTRARRRTKGENCIRAFFSLINSNRARYGGFLAHIGIILIALGVIVSSFYSIERTATLDIGESMSIGNYKLTYNELMLKQDNVKVSAVASILVSQNNGQPVTTMHPSYNYWFQFRDHFAEVAVRTTPAEDLFVSLVWTGFDPRDRSATFRVLVNPLIVWIWVGGGFFVLGGAVALFPKDKRQYGAEG